ncbi:MAG: pentapeptide repeat-containing protein [Saprospiraceae bacterium]
MKNVLNSSSPFRPFTITITTCLMAACLLLSAISIAKAQGQAINASEIIDQINKMEPVEITGKTIVGDLDFSRLDKQFRGGSYGVRNGVVKEFYSKLHAPLQLKDCVIKGAIITFSSDQKPGLLKENFVAFDELASFENCRFEQDVTFERMTFYQGLVIKDCIFQEGLTFNKVHFSKPPVISGGNVLDQLKSKDTNWSSVPSELQPMPPMPNESNSVTLILRNPTLKSIDIRFERKTWTLSPLGYSSLVTEPGTEIYLLKNGKKDRLLLTAAKEMDGEEFDMSKL